MPGISLHCQSQTREKSCLCWVCKQARNEKDKQIFKERKLEKHSSQMAQVHYARLEEKFKT